MKKGFSYLPIILMLLFFSCKNKKQNSLSDHDAESQNSKDFYPIGSFIRSQLESLDSLPLAIIKYKTIGTITDTSIVEKKDFKHVAEALVLPDISSPELKKQYDETSFVDATIGTITLTYSPKNEKAQIRKADVLLKQDDTSVRSIYIEKNSLNAGDSLVMEKILWTANRNCQVTTIIQKKDSPEKIITEKYVWDSRN